MDYLTIFLALFVFMRYEVCKSRKIGKGVFFGGERINQVKVRVDDMFLGAFRVLSLIHMYMIFDKMGLEWIFGLYWAGLD